MMMYNDDEDKSRGICLLLLSLYCIRYKLGNCAEVKMPSLSAIVFQQITWIIKIAIQIRH